MTHCVPIPLPPPPEALIVTCPVDPEIVTLVPATIEVTMPVNAEPEPVVVRYVLESTDPLAFKN